MTKIAIIGIGRLGLCFALNAEKVGYKVYGIDTKEDYVQALKSKSFVSQEPFVDDFLKTAIHFFPSSTLDVIFDESISFIYIMVPTPSLPDGSFSHQYIDEVVSKILEFDIPRDRKHIVIGATTMPGYCEELALKLENHNYSVTYNPEFIAQGSIIHDQQFPDQLLIGEGDPDATQLLLDIYAKMCKSKPEVHVMDRTSAEITKLATNCFLTMKISFANAIGDFATKMDAVPEKILNAIGSDSRIGKKYLNYGFGFGGPCFPRDNQALQHAAKRVNYPLLLSESTVKVNQMHLDFQMKELLAQNLDFYVFESVSYKPQTDILEESQQLALALKLVQAGKKVVLKNSSHVQHQLQLLYPNYFAFE